MAGNDSRRTQASTSSRRVPISIAASRTRSPIADSTRHRAETPKDCAVRERSIARAARPRLPRRPERRLPGEVAGREVGVDRPHARQILCRVYRPMVSPQIIGGGEDPPNPVGLNPLTGVFLIYIRLHRLPFQRLSAEDLHIQPLWPERRGVEVMGVVATSYQLENPLAKVGVEQGIVAGKPHDDISLGPLNRVKEPHKYIGWIVRDPAVYAGQPTELRGLRHRRRQYDLIDASNRLSAFEDVTEHREPIDLRQHLPRQPGGAEARLDDGDHSAHSLAFPMMTFPNGFGPLARLNWRPAGTCA